MTPNDVIDTAWNRFALHGLGHRGDTFDFVWTWPAGARTVNLAAVLQTSSLSDEALLGALQSCNLHQMGDDKQPIWVLGNSSRDVLCSVNSRTLSAGQQVRLEHGDHIEVGLTRFQVRMLEGTQSAIKPAPEAVELLDAFDLTDLARPDEVHHFSHLHTDISARSDISDLISLEPAAAPAAQRPTEAAVPPKADPLEALHAQYLKKIRDPLSVEHEDLWSDVSRSATEHKIDPMQSLMDAAGSASGLDDLLGQPQSIASVIDSLNTLSSTKLLDPEPFASVMHLFAPENLRQLEQDSLEAIVQRSLPGLTRQEHHSLAVDSAMPPLFNEARPAQESSELFKTSP